jgi:NAD+ kinase
MKIALYARGIKNKESLEVLSEILHFLKERQVDILIHPELLSEWRDKTKKDNFNVFSPEDFLKNPPDYLISVGGDGTILDTLSIVRDSGVPVLGINTGRFGFLSSCRASEVKMALNELMSKSYSIENRTVLMLESNYPVFDDFPYALNDFVLHKKDSSSMIIVHAYLNGEFLNSYWADGLIIASPTGSTGYSLSCGGPILFPQSGSFVITPIAPHNLNVRPAVISDDHVLSFEIEGRSHSFLCSMDARSESIRHDIQLAVRKADFSFKLIRLSNENFLSTLRTKLMWGLDNRN